MSIARTGIYKPLAPLDIHLYIALWNKSPLCQSIVINQGELITGFGIFESGGKTVS